MKNSKIIDFEPSLFGDAPRAIEPQEPRNAVNGGLKIRELELGNINFNKKGIVIACLLLIGAAVVAATTFNGSTGEGSKVLKDGITVQNKSPWYADKKELLVPDLAAKPFAIVESSASAKLIPGPVYAGRNSADQDRCRGDEIVCTAIATGTPVETLQKIVSAIPVGSRKRYKVYLTVSEIEDFQEAKRISD